MQEPIAQSSQDIMRVGVSSCLLGEKIRFNAGHKYDEFIVEHLGKFFEWIPVCPEFELGLGVPRESMHLKEKDGSLKLITTQTARDFTDEMLAYAGRKVRALKRQSLRGYLFKKSSPSCGMERVRIHRSDGISRYDGRGLFASTLMKAYPSLPVEEEGRLRNPVLRENWIERVFAYHELRNLFESNWKIRDLVRFHTRYKLVLLSHSTVKYAELGRIVAEANLLERTELAGHYESKFMRALMIHATPKKNANVMQHMLGHLKKKLDQKTKHDILRAVEDYRLGLFPLTVPLTLLKHFIEKHEIDYLESQAYLEPHPKQLALRNFVHIAV
jgi:uncharacterized protein YbgA (DUF1722 family)/uncharacterized protein YbbK (DUF523 family)